MTIEEEQIDARAKESSSGDNNGTYNLVFSPKDDLAHVWRVSSGNNLEKRKTHIKNWIDEVELMDVMAKSDIGPGVKKTVTKGSWLTETKYRVAILLAKYDMDMFMALSNRFKASALFGSTSGPLLVHKCIEMGSTCLLHTDLKPENILINLIPVENDFVAFEKHHLLDLRIIDFDPQYIYIGCDCVKASVKKALHNEGDDLVASKWEAQLREALFCVLHLLMFWMFLRTWFLFGYETEASQSLKKYLEGELQRSSYPLDAVYPHLTVNITSRIDWWVKSYVDKYNNKSYKKTNFLASVTKEFKSMRASEYTWANPPIVADIVFDRARTAKQKQSKILSARKRLVEIANKCDLETISCHTRKSKIKPQRFVRK